MTLSLHTLRPKKGSRSDKKRIGRGLGSKGSYSGRGVKGQRARSGGRDGLKKLGIRSLMLSTPKNRGFKVTLPRPHVVNVGDLNKEFTSGSKINPKILLLKSLVSDISAGVKILGTGSLKKKLTIEGCAFSESAKQKIEKAGGTITATA